MRSKWISPKIFDVVVIGGGINGCAATQELAAAGFCVALVEKNDYASGSSSRSTRLLHCGLRYLASGGSPYSFLKHPIRFLNALKMTKTAMQARADFVLAAPGRWRKFTFGFPVWQGMAYRPWHVDAALRIVESVGPATPPLERGLLKPSDIAAYPLFTEVRDPDSLLGINTYTEYQFDWPERVAMDMVLDATRMGAQCMNYTQVVEIKSGKAKRWQIVASDRAGNHLELQTDVIVNTAGIWIDKVNQLANPQASRRVLGTKGAHIVLRLPPACQNQGLITLNREMEEPIYLVPWKNGLHYMGVTETVYEDDIDDVRATDDDIDWLLSEFNHLLPDLTKTREDVLYTWAGVRPLTYDPALPKGARNRLISHLHNDRLDGVLAMTAGPVTTHRSAGHQLRDAVQKLIRPTGAKIRPNYAPPEIPSSSDSPNVLNQEDSITVSQLRYCAQNEQVWTLTDLLARRTGLAWTQSRGREGARFAAQAVADLMGWDEAQIDRETQKYLDYVNHTLRKPVDN